MDLKELLGESYKDGMTVEEITEALAGVEMPKPTDNSAEIAKLKESVTKANAEASKYKKELSAKLSDDERKAKEDAEKWEQIAKERDELLREKNISTHKAKFLENGFSAELADSSAQAIVDGDFETVFKNLGEYRKSIEKQFKAENIDNMPKPNGGSGKAPEMTQEQFDAMTYNQRVELYQKNKELYEKLSKGD